MSTSALPTPSGPMIDTGSMLANVPADLFAGADAIEVPVSDDAPPDAPVEDTESPSDEPVIDEPASEPTTEDEPVADEPPIDAATDTDTPPAANPTEEEMPEGTIREKDAKGRYKYSLDENRYKTVYGNHQLVQQANEVLGEPLTVDGIQHLRDSYLGSERLWNNVTSGDPALQESVVDELLTQMRQAQEGGEVGVDPTVPFAEVVYNKLKSANGDANAHLRMLAARDLVNELYDLAAGEDNADLLHSVGHVVAALSGAGKRTGDMTSEQYAQHVASRAKVVDLPLYSQKQLSEMRRPEDPAAALRRENEELKARLNGTSGKPNAAEQFADWNRSHVQDVNKAVFDQAVKPALASVEEAWKQFPEPYNDLVVDRLNRLVTKDIREDSALTHRVNEMLARAQRATSEQMRQQIGKDIQQLFVNRANISAQKHRADVLKFASEALKGRSAQTHARRSAGQTRTAPQGQSTPVRQSAVPTPAKFDGGVFTPDQAYNQALAALNGR